MAGGGGVTLIVNNYINAIDGASVEAVIPKIAESLDRLVKGAGGVGVL